MMTGQPKQRASKPGTGKASTQASFVDDETSFTVQRGLLTAVIATPPAARSHIQPPPQPSIREHPLAGLVRAVARSAALAAFASSTHRKSAIGEK
jgi:hypothetical protein